MRWLRCCAERLNRERPQHGVCAMNLWLDDVRPAPDGFTHVKTVDEAMPYLISGEVEKASLDHDLGDGATGYWLVSWMEENDIWPKEKPLVHSMNPWGAHRMREVIARKWP